jgi:hypothetical protein
VGADAEGTSGDEEAGYVEYAGFDPGVEAEGTWKRVEEVAEWEGEVGWLMDRALVKVFRLNFWQPSVSYEAAFDVSNVYNLNEIHYAVSGYPTD